MEDFIRTLNVTDIRSDVSLHGFEAAAQGADCNCEDNCDGGWGNCDCNCDCGKGD